MKRIESIDIFRAITVFLMIFVNDLPSIKGVPHWMGHATIEENFLGLSDLVFPTFLFILGMSIPLAINSRLKRGDSKLNVIIHIVRRSLALIIMGVFSVNSGSNLSDLSYISAPVFSIITLVAFFLIWNDYNNSKKEKRTTYTILKVIGVCTLIYLTYTYNQFSNSPISVKWWGILGLIGWTYLCCAILYIYFNKKHKYLIYITVFFISLCILSTANKLNYFNGVILSNGCFHSFTMVGMMCSLLFTSKSYNSISLKKKFNIILSSSIIFLLLGFISNQWWDISKLRETAPWLFYCLGISMLTYLIIYWIVDIKQKGHWFNILKPAGIATLTCYLLPSFFYALIQLTELTFSKVLTSAPIGILKCVCFSIVCIYTTKLLGKINIKLKI